MSVGTSSPRLAPPTAQMLEQLQATSSPGDAAVEAAKRAFKVPPAFGYEFAYDEDAHANATVYVDPVSNP